MGGNHRETDSQIEETAHRQSLVMMVSCGSLQIVAGQPHLEDLPHRECNTEWKG